MSSIYQSTNDGPLCHHCRVPLAANDLQCAHCGYTHVSSTLQRNQQLSTWNQNSHPQQPDLPAQTQHEGLLKRYRVQAEQRNRYIPPASFQPTPQPQVAPRPVSSQLPLHTTSPSSRMEQQAGRVPSIIQPPNLHIPYSLSKNQVRSQRINRERTIGLLLLLLALLGGSFLAYTIFFAQKNIQHITNSSSSHSSTTTSTVLQGTSLFHDMFTKNTNGWSIQRYPGEFSVALGNGALTLDSENNKLLWELIPGGTRYGDFQLSVDAVLSKGSQQNGYGIYIRGTLSPNGSLTNSYRFELYGDGTFAIFKDTTDTHGTMTTSHLIDYIMSPSIQKQGNPNHITINAQGSRLQFIVNAHLMSTIVDTTYSSGCAALFVSNLQKASPGAEAIFSHLAIYAIGIH